MKRMFLFLLVFVFMASYTFSRPKIVWFSHLAKDAQKRKSPFWKLSRDFIIATADDLDVDFKIYYSNRDHIKMINQAKSVISKEETRPDGIIFHNFKHVAKPILKTAEEYKVKSLIFNAGFSEQDKIGKPGELYKHWIGTILPDDYYAGLLLTEKLMEEAYKTELFENNKKINTVSFLGGLYSQASALRKKGFEKRLNNEKFEMLQYVHAGWWKNKAKASFANLIRRYSNISMVWCACDAMALGVIEAAHENNLKPGKDFVTGGIDLLKNAIRAIQNGEMAVSVGGQYVEGSFAVILMYDYLSSNTPHNPSYALKTKMFALTKLNINDYKELDKKLNFESIGKIDFKKYSKTHNKQLKHYNFSIKEILKQL